MAAIAGRSGWRDRRTSGVPEWKNTSVVGLSRRLARIRLYSVACDVYVLRKNPVFREYWKQHPERVPPADAGRPLLPILVEYFCTGMWRQLIDAASCQVGPPSKHMGHGEAARVVRTSTGQRKHMEADACPTSANSGKLWLCLGQPVELIRALAFRSSSWPEMRPNHEIRPELNRLWL